MSRTAFSYRDDPEVPDFPDADPVLIFDGECVMCSHSAAFVLKHERHKRCNFVAAQSALGGALYRHYDLDDDDFETFVLLHRGTAHFRSDAALRLLSLLGLPWSLASVFRRDKLIVGFPGVKASRMKNLLHDPNLPKDR